MQLIRLDHVGRQDIHNVTERPQQNTVLQEETIELWSKRGKVTRIIGHQFDCSHRPDLPRVADLMHFAQVREAFGVDSRDRCDAVKHRFVLENLQAGVCRGAGQGVSGVGMAVVEGVQSILAAECRFHAICAKRRAHGHKSAREAFRQTHQVWDNICQSAGKHLAGTTESGENLVRNEENIVFRAHRAYLLQKLHGMHNHPASALQQRFNDHRGDLFASFGQQSLQLLNALDVAAFTPQSHRAAVAVGRMHAVHGVAHGAKRRRERRLVAHGHRSRGIPVVAVRQRHNLALLRALQVLEVLHCLFQGNFDRG